MWVQDGPVLDIHHTSRLKGIEVEVIKDLTEGIGRVIGIDEFLVSVQLVGPDVHLYIHGVVDLLLPVTLGKNPGCCHQQGQQEQSVLHMLIFYCNFMFSAVHLTRGFNKSGS